MPCKVPERGWGFANSEEMQRQIALGLVEFRADHTEPPFRKAHIRPVPDELDDEASGEVDDAETGAETESEELATQVRGSYFYKQSQVEVKYLRKLMGAKLFDNPKDHEELARLIKYMLGQAQGQIVMDFFAGSGTTAEAVLRVNNELESNHHFILVQLPEPCNPKEKAGKAALNAGLTTIAEITKERVRRVITKLDESDTSREGEFIKADAAIQDRGFRVFKLMDSNFKPWDSEVPHESGALAQQLDLYIDHIKEGRNDHDLLFEILLKRGFPLTTTVEVLSLAGHEVFGVAGNGMLVCLERDLSLDLIRAMADLTPECVVCLDEGFAGNDQLKTNAVQIFKTKGVAKFLTV
jgi:adenine-specific DNA-methyltransferase